MGTKGDRAPPRLSKAASSSTSVVPLTNRLTPSLKCYLPRSSTGLTTNARPFRPGMRRRSSRTCPCTSRCDLLKFTHRSLVAFSQASMALSPPARQHHYVQQHNVVMPHSAFNGATPDEVYVEKAEGVVEHLKARRAEAQTLRLAVNRRASCSGCSPSPSVVNAKPRVLPPLIRSKQLGAVARG